MAETPDDKALLERFRNPATRDAAFNELVLAYQQRVYWHVRRLVISHEDADDLVQEIFIRIWNHLDNFRGDAQLFTWIYRIATNECTSLLKRKKMKPTVSIDQDEGRLLERSEEHTSELQSLMRISYAVFILKKKNKL